ncbi:ATPase [Blastopirellula marina]|uniref:ATPase n=1 Tax=Blastopirellula marina TaxID=124 RepID=A0A2S8FDM4_9BACT|nr:MULTISPECIES: ATPase [Pirellulaceae]PQO30024.1 ATPase [Blastopirellula marina]RCS50459.1 ATPase [Bremerella cremea]
MPRKSNKFRFKKNATIGAPAAEEDAFFLEKCFVDTGDLEVLRDCENPKRLIIGRTGAGKTALLMRLQETEEHVITVSPFNLSVEFVSNSNVIRFFSELGVKLDLFYKLLWRHVFTVEILREKYAIHSRADQQRFWQSLPDIFKRDKRKKEALDYLKKHGESFFKETEERVKEATRKTESDLRASISGVLPNIDFSVGSARKLSDEQKVEVCHRGQEVVNQVKVRDLNEMFNLLTEGILTDKQQKFYVVIDGLDEHWIDDSIRFHLIRALIDTIREFQKVRTVKIVACLRTDLIERVFRYTRASGLQEEKMKGLYLHLHWTREELIQLVNQRVQYLVRDAFTNSEVTCLDILPVSKKSPTAFIDYEMPQKPGPPL